MTPHQFITKWTARGFGERQAAQTWFLDLLRLVGHPDPVEYNDRGATRRRQALKV